MQPGLRQLGIEGGIAKVPAHGRFILGPEVADLEASLARRAGCARAVGVSSGTDALIPALMAILLAKLEVFEKALATRARLARWSDARLTR